MNYTRYSRSTVSDNRAYGNIAVYSPDDILMFYTNQNKLKFYLKNDLAEKIDENKYRLKFIPNGLGYSAENNEFGGHDCLVPRENKCVVSGEENIKLLSKHHIVPSFFRKHFPVEFKSCFQTIVLLRRDLHSQYTVHEQAFYDELAEMFDVPKYSTFRVNSVTPREKKLAIRLHDYGHLIPEEAKQNMEQEFTDRTGLEPTKENLSDCIKLVPIEKRVKTVETDFGMAIASKITDYRAFELLWLNHFIEHAKPKYLPEDLVKSYQLEV